MKTRRTAGTGCLFKRGRYWYLRIKKPGGKMIMRSLRDPITNERPTTKTHAEKIAAVLAAEISTGGKIGLNGYDNDKLTNLTKLECSYREAFESQWDINRIRNHTKLMSRFLERFPTVESITHERLGQYVKERLSSLTEKTKKPVSPSTINRELSELRRLLNWGLQTEKIIKNPMCGFKFLKETEHRERILNEDEVERFTLCLGR